MSSSAVLARVFPVAIVIVIAFASADGRLLQEPGADAVPPVPEVERAQGLLEKARASFVDQNHPKAIKQAEAAIREIGDSSDPAAGEIRFGAQILILHAKIRLQEDPDVLERLAEIESRFPDRLTAALYRETATDLAFAGDFAHAMELLARASERFGAEAEGIGRYSRNLTLLRETTHDARVVPPKVDAGFLQTTRRNRPQSSKDLVDYALRALNFGAADIALLAFWDASWRQRSEEASATEAGLARRVLAAYNEVLAWIVLGRNDVAMQRFEQIDTEFPGRLTWIEHMQIGTKLADAGAKDAARSIFEAGKVRFPDRADRFEAAIRGL